MELSTQLSQEQRLLVEGQYRKTIEDWPKATEAYRSLFNLFPDSLDYGILLASVQIHVSPAAAMETLAVLRRLPSPMGDDARIDRASMGFCVNKLPPSTRRRNPLTSVNPPFKLALSPRILTGQR